MVKKSTLRNTLLLTSVVLLLACVAAPVTFAAAGNEEVGAENQGGTSVGEGIRIAGLALAAGIAMAGGALGTGRAQAAIGAAGAGAVAEKRELFVTVIVLIALPETVVILGFVFGFLLLNTI